MILDEIVMCGGAFILGIVTGDGDRMSYGMRVSGVACGIGGVTVGILVSLIT